MKRALSTVALLGAATSVAMAQSSSTNVVMQIIVDASARATHNSLGTLKSLSSGNNSTSRLVLRGSEDLGDGLKAGFWLEGSLFTDSGTAGGLAATPSGQFWDRTSIVKLESPRWGDVRFGREWTPVFLGWVYSDPFIAVGVGSAANFFSSGTSTVLNRAFGSAVAPSTISRSSNALQYWLPGGLGGIYGQAMAAAGEGANAQGSFRYLSGRLGWKNETFDANVYHGRTRIDAANADLKQTGVYGAYNASFVRLAASVTESKFLSSKQTNYILGVSVPIDVHLIRASYNRADQRGRSAAGVSIDNDDGSMVALGYQYSLSKRTALYAQAAHITNKGNARFQAPGGPLGIIAAGSASTGYEAGMRTSF